MRPGIAPSFVQGDGARLCWPAFFSVDPPPSPFEGRLDVSRPRGKGSETPEEIPEQEEGKDKDRGEDKEKEKEKEKDKRKRKRKDKDKSKDKECVAAKGGTLPGPVPPRARVVAGHFPLQIDCRCTRSVRRHGGGGERSPCCFETKVDLSHGRRAKGSGCSQSFGLAGQASAKVSGPSRLASREG